MDRSSLILTVVVIAAMAFVVVVQSIVVVKVTSHPQTAIATSPAVAGGSQRASQPSSSGTIWDEYFKPSIAPTATIIAAFVAGIFAYRSLLKNLRISTRNSFLDMLVGEKDHRDELNAFLGAANNGNFTDLKNRMDDAALHYLFLLKPKRFKEQFKAAVEKQDRGRTHDLIRELFTA